MIDDDTDRKGRVQLLNLRGLERLGDGEAEEALEYFRSALAHAPEAPVVLNNMGNALVRLGRLGEARDAYERAIRAGPATISRTGISRPSTS